MDSFTVTPEELRAAAAKVDAMVGDVPASVAIEVMSDVGHTRLAAAVASFAAALGRSWQARRRSTDGIAANLRRTAEIYETADDDGAASVRAGSGGAF